MQIPKRRSQTLKTVYDEDAVLLTPEGLKRLKSERERLDKIERPQAVQDVYEARQKGDLSENAEYQEARARLSRLQSRIFNIGEKLKRVIPIEKTAAGRIGIGSSVVLIHGDKSKTYQIVSPHEADILRGRLSHLSPLGTALLNHKMGDVVKIKANEMMQEYAITEVK
jgi:transcription elongation factor GreA